MINLKMKKELEKLLINYLMKYKRNATSITNDEFKSLVQLYREVNKNKSNHKRILIVDLIPSVALVCITSILVTLLLLVMQML